MVIGLILDQQIIYGSTLTVQLIVLILNKQIISGSTLTVQLIVLILNKQFLGAHWMYSCSADFK